MEKRHISIDAGHRKALALERFKKDLGEEYACLVVIACTHPDAKGKMDVSLDFEGDETLASFLVENAAQAFEDRDISRETK